MEPTTETPMVQHVFDEADFGGGVPSIRGAGSDRFTLAFVGKGPRAFLATFADGRPATKPVDGFRVETLRFVPVGSMLENGEPDPEGDVLSLIDRPMDAKVTTTNTAGIGVDQRPICQVKVEMHVRRCGEGLVRDLTGDPLEDGEILDPDLYLQIGRLTGRSGTLFLIRSDAQDEKEVRGPFDPPEGVKERSLRRGSRKAAAALRDAVEAKHPDGVAVPMGEVREKFDADPEMNLRTWDGGPVKVLKGFTLVYILTMPVDAATATADMFEAEPGKDSAGDQGQE